MRNVVLVIGMVLITIVILTMLNSHVHRVNSTLGVDRNEILAPVTPQ